MIKTILATGLLLACALAQPAWAGQDSVTQRIAGLTGRLQRVRPQIHTPLRLAATLEHRLRELSKALPYLPQAHVVTLMRQDHDAPYIDQGVNKVTATTKKLVGTQLGFFLLRRDAVFMHHGETPIPMPNHWRNDALALPIALQTQPMALPHSTKKRIHIDDQNYRLGTHIDVTQLIGRLRITGEADITRIVERGIAALEQFAKTAEAVASKGD